MIETKKAETLLNTNEVAERLGVTRRHARLLIQQGKLPAEKIGRDWFVSAKDLKLVQNRPKRGRPRKTKSDEDKEEDE